MKTKKWLWITLSVLLTLVVLAGVGAAGYRLGLTQNPAFIKQMAELRAQRQPKIEKQKPGQPPQQNDQAFDPRMQGVNPQNDFGRGFDRGYEHGFDRGHDRGRGESPLFGLLHLIVIGALLWFAYKYAKNSGWKLVRETPQPAPAANVEEKKDEA